MKVLRSSEAARLRLLLFMMHGEPVLLLGDGHRTIQACLNFLPKVPQRHRQTVLVHVERDWTRMTFKDWGQLWNMAVQRIQKTHPDVGERIPLCDIMFEPQPRR